MFENSVKTDRFADTGASDDNAEIPFHDCAAPLCANSIERNVPSAKPPWHPLNPRLLVSLNIRWEDWRQSMASGHALISS